MSSTPYAPPKAPAGDPLESLKMPREVRAAIALSWIVLVLKSGNNLWKISQDPEVGADLLFTSLWLGITATAIALTAVFIYFASRHRNWGRVGLLVWTLGSWVFWLMYPPAFSEYPWWKWTITATLIAMELVALLLLFGEKGSAWYRLRGQAQ